MKIIAGLGNIGKEYDKTRHNIGFMVADELARRWNLENAWRTDRNAMYVEYRAPEKVFLLKPVTYMNLSGNAVGPWAHFYNIAPEEVAVVHDDMDLPLGTIRIRKNGSSGGQKGMKSIISALGTEQIARIRIGVGHSEPGVHEEVPDWVLSPVPKAEQEIYQAALKDAAEAAEAWVSEPFDQVMSKYNIRLKQ